ECGDIRRGLEARAHDGSTVRIRHQCGHLTGNPCRLGKKSAYQHAQRIDDAQLCRSHDLGWEGFEIDFERICGQPLLYAIGWPGVAACCWLAHVGAHTGYKTIG